MTDPTFQMLAPSSPMGVAAGLHFAHAAAGQLNRRPVDGRQLEVRESMRDGKPLVQSGFRGDKDFEGSNQRGSTYYHIDPVRPDSNSQGQTHRLLSTYTLICWIMAINANLILHRPAPAQTVSIQDRTIASYGPEGGDTFETSLALTRWHRLCAFVTNNPTRIRAASGSNQNSTWTALDAWTGSIPFAADDPSIGVISASAGESRFVVFGRTLGSLSYSTYSSLTGFGPVLTAVSGANSIDKSWVVRRTSSEWIVFWWDGPTFKYLTSNSGETWGESDTPPRAPHTVTADVAIPAYFCCQPAVAADGSVYLAYATGDYAGGGRIRILRGTGAGAPLAWTHLRAVGGDLIELPVRLSQSAELPVPHDAVAFYSKTVPQTATDPNDSEVIYVAYHDVAADDASDMNVYLQRCSSTTNGWTLLSNPIRVNDDIDLPQSVRNDQFTPAISVDSASRVHVIFYDNREGQCNAATPPEFDVYHALSTDAGMTFTNRNLRQDCDQDRPLNAGLHVSGNVGPYFSPREYNGIAIYNSGSTARVWMTYAGTSGTDPDTGNISVIYGQLLTVTD